MRSIFFVPLFFLVYSTSCKTITAPNINEEENKQAIYLSTPFPFLIEGVCHSVILPKSFQIYGNGKAVVYLFINNQGKKEGFSIVLLDLGKEKGKNFYEFSNAPKGKSMYPLDVQPFFFIIKKEIAKIKIKKKKNIQILKGQKYYYTIVYDLK